MARVRLDGSLLLLRPGRRPDLLRAEIMNALVLAASSGGSSSSSGSFLITPNVGLMIWTLLLFGISMVVLAKLAFPRISQALERRQRAIEDSIDAAERTREQADQLLADYRERLREARKQAEEIVQRARR